MRHLLIALFALAACGEVKTPPNGPDDGGIIDAPEAPPTDAATDAPIDAPPTPPPPPGTARELTVVGGAVSDTRFRLELEISGGVAPLRASNANHALEGATTVTVPRGGN